MSNIVKIKPLIDIADDLQMNRGLRSDTERHLASKLFVSLEDWEYRLNKGQGLTPELTYWLAFDTFHSAKAFDLLTTAKHSKVNKILKTMKKIMKEYEPSNMDVVL